MKNAKPNNGSSLADSDVLCQIKTEHRSASPCFRARSMTAETASPVERELVLLGVTTSRGYCAVSNNLWNGLLLSIHSFIIITNA